MGRRVWMLLSAAMLLAAWSGWARAEERPAEAPRNIVLVGWDGAQREHVMQCLEKGELPNLKKLSSEGKLVNIDIRGTTDTKAGWSQILSGYDPGVTGVYSNGRFQPVPKGLSVFERLKAHFGADKFVCAAAIGKKQHCGEIDPPSRVEIKGADDGDDDGKQDDKDDNQENDGKKEGKKARKGKDKGAKIVEEGGKRYRVFPGSPYYIMKDACDKWVFALIKDEKVGAQAIEFLEQYKDKPFFFFVHFAEVDHKGHQHGENSKEYNDALISNDAWTGKIVEKLKALGLYDKTIVYVTADHGFDEGGTSHKKAPFVFLGTNDPKVCRDGDRADITPTILDRFGLDLSKLDPPLAGHSLLRPAEPKK